MLIEPLADCAEAIPMLAQWFCEEWAYEERPRGAVEAQLRGNLNRDRVPITWVRRAGGEVIGTVSLDLSDLPVPAYAQLSPWLASLYVVPSARTGCRTGAGESSAGFCAVFVDFDGVSLDARLDRVVREMRLEDF